MKIIKEQQLWEMARVGKYDIFDVYVHTDDSGKIPHFHIWDEATRGQQFHTCIKLLSAEYFHHTGKEGILNTKQRKELIKFLTSKPNNNRYETYWQLLVDMWNINNSDVIVNSDIEMPDYTLL